MSTFGVFLLLILFASGAGAKDLCFDPGHDRVKEEVCRRTNSARVSLGLKPLELSSSLNFVAQKFAHDMAKRGFFDHTSPDGADLRQRYAAHRIPWNACGENIAQGAKSAREVVNVWLASPQHREILLNAHYKKLGIGRAGGYWVQDFSD